MAYQNNLRKTLAAMIVLFLPTKIARIAVRPLEYHIHPEAKIGFSWIWCEKIILSWHANVGHLNYITTRRLILHREASIGRMNILRGGFSTLLKPKAAIGNSNKILRGRPGVSSGPAQLKLGQLTKITVEHRIDCTQTVNIGAFSILAGAATQLWTHGYIHEMDGPSRYRIDGRIEIGNNVYIGSASIISMGVRIGNGVTVGGGTSVAKDLLEPGLYVSAPIRALPRPALPSERKDLRLVDDPHLVETVYIKTRN